LAEHANFPVVDVKETGRRIRQLRERRAISGREVRNEDLEFKWHEEVVFVCRGMKYIETGQL